MYLEIAMLKVLAEQITSQVVFCDLSRFNSEPTGQLYWDSHNAMHFDKASYDELHSNRETTEAKTVQDIHDGKPLVGASIYIYPWYIKKMAKRDETDGWTAVLNNDAKAREMIKEVINGIGRNWKDVKAKIFPSGSRITRIDAVHAVLDGTMLHEVSVQDYQKMMDELTTQTAFAYLDSRCSGRRW